LTLNKIVILIDVICFFTIVCSLTQKTLLPYAYIFAVVIMAVLLALSLVKNSGHTKIVILQIFLIFFLTRNIYYLSTQNFIPFADAYWDYAVEKTFWEQGRIFVIHGVVRPTEVAGISQLTWYSGWPLLHSLGFVFCRVSGIDPFYLNWILPQFFNLISFAFVYLLFEKLRVRLSLRKEITILALLIYATAPEAIFWQIQFVRQGLALALLGPILYLLCFSISGPFDRRYDMILRILALFIVVTHHFTAFTLTLFLILLSAIKVIANNLGKGKRSNRFFSSFGKTSFISLGLLVFVFMFIWWEQYGFVVLPTIESRIDLFIENLREWGVDSSVLASFSYPSSLRPMWVTPLLGSRDLMMYAPALMGLLLLWSEKSRIPEKFFVVYSVLAFGAIFIIYDAFLALEPLRIILLMMPFLAFLSSLFYYRILGLSRTIGKTILFIIVILFVLASFTGLWAHNFAPVHLYDPSVNPVSVGEGTPSFTRLKPFFENKINFTNIENVRADVISRLVYLMDPDDYDKIKSLPTQNLNQLSTKNSLICSFKDLNLYVYYGYIWSPIETVEEAETLQHELRQYLSDNSNYIYNDGSNSIWATLNDTW